jgi:small subunit ribosomal protein S6
MITKDYEALFILKTTGTEQEIAQAASSLEDPIKKAGGRIDRAQTLGRRRLAFRIARQGEGVYHVLRFWAPTESVSELDRVFRLNERIVRFIILDGEEVPVGPPAPVPANA